MTAGPPFGRGDVAQTCFLGLRLFREPHYLLRWLDRPAKSAEMCVIPSLELATGFPD
jgi:hypothetical protein